MNKIVTIASSALTLVLSGAVLAGGADHMTPAAPVAPMAASVPSASGVVYVGIHGGYVMSSGKFDNGTSPKPKMSDNFKNGFVGGAEVGYQMKGDLPIRIELSGDYYSLAKKKPATQDFTSFDVMGNVYYDFAMGQFSPYLGLGVGFTHISLKDTATSSDSGLAYQGMAGIAYKFNPNMDIEAGYRLMATTAEVKDKNTPTTKYKFGSAMFHSFQVGLHYYFS